MYYKLLSLLYSRDNDNHEISELEYQAMVTDLQPILNGRLSPSTSHIMGMNLAQAFLHTLYSSRHTTLNATTKMLNKDHHHAHAQVQDDIEALVRMNYYILCCILVLILVVLAGLILTRKR